MQLLLALLAISSPVEDLAPSLVSAFAAVSLSPKPQFEARVLQLRTLSSIEGGEHHFLALVRNAREVRLEGSRYGRCSSCSRISARICHSLDRRRRGSDEEDYHRTNLCLKR